MTTPRATYRLQLRDGMDFGAACAIIPYLAHLGVSHLYLSPVFTANAGSTHGYDVIDCNEIDPSLGGRVAFEALSTKLRAHGLGLILDIVPNHMAASLSNRWWRDVLLHGKHSAFAGFFDIDWLQALTLPVLGKPFSEALEAGELRLERTEGDGVWHIAYFGQHFPLAPETWNLAASGAPNDGALIALLHEQQHWRLTFWKHASKHLTYRRFFEVTGLVGMRVEHPAVFEATHALILDLVDHDLIDGLRVDHIDGLSQPTHYLERLRARVGADIYLIVEKITEGEESLRDDWPVDGTTGYEFIAAAAMTLVDAKGVARLETASAELSGGSFDFEAETRDAKQQIASVNFAGELDRLVALAAGRLNARTDDLRAAIREILIAFPVYRTYADASGVSPADAALLNKVRDAAALHADPATIDAVIALLSREPGEFQTRFQQLSGPIMAKSVEDTLFYRDCRLLALNEVGCNPQDGLRASAALAHQRFGALVASQPRGMRATATHDTKRGEDARARLYALSEMPDAFANGVRRWSAMSGNGPDAQTRWMIFQALVGIWPLDNPDPATLETLRGRFFLYLEKALREAKRQTNWSDPEEAYEERILAYADSLFDPACAAFHADFGRFVKRLHLPGWMNSLAQITIKLTLPGVPDIYQGTEAFDDSLVDPDNRRPVPFGDLTDSLSLAPLLWQDWLEANTKQRLIHRLLMLKTNAHGAGPYTPLKVSGANAEKCFAFSTVFGGRQAIVAVPRLTAELYDETGGIPPSSWKESLLRTNITGGALNVATGGLHEVDRDIALCDLFRQGPMAILIVDDGGW